MNIVALNPVGRFPTVVSDPGPWWSAIAALPGHELTGFSLNYAWWRAVCSSGVRQALLAPLTLAQRIRRRVEWRSRGLDLRRSGRAAGRALDQLRSPRPYQEAQTFVAAVAPLAEHLAALNEAATDLQFLLNGVRVGDLNYDYSRALVEYSRADSALSETIRPALDDCPRSIDLLIVRINSAEELLTAMIAVRHLRSANPAMHVCLADHGYENFSLRPYLDILRASGALTEVFDTIIESKGDRDALLPALAAALASGETPRGFLRRDDLPAVAPPAADRLTAPPTLPTFCSEPILWTRISGRRCHWSRCAFCVQNNKYDSPQSPLPAEIPATLDRIESYLAAGYRTLIFSDEALPPRVLKALCEGILERGLKFRWACRCRLGRAWSRELFDLMRRAGCYEVLYGLESISPRMQDHMRKYAKGLDRETIRETFRMMHDAGVGTHVNLLANFPGDTAQEMWDTVEFTVEALEGVARATFTLNRFALFPDTPVHNNAAEFGVTVEPAYGDMPSRYDYRLTPKLATEAEQIDSDLHDARDRLLTGLHWDRLGRDPGAEAARSLYFEFGAGAIFKQQPTDVFAVEEQQVLEAVG